MDQMSEAPSLPAFSFLITSGAMYIGVPASEFITAAPSATCARGLFAARVLAMVLFPLTMTWTVSGSGRHQFTSPLLLQSRQI